MACYNMSKRSYKKKAALGALLGVGTQVLGMGLNAIMQAKARKKEEQERKRQILIDEAGQRVLDGNALIAYDNQYNMATGGMMDESGLPLALPTGPANLLNGSASQVSDGYSLNGPSHAAGGMDLDMDMDGMAEYELEGDEIIRGQKVYSNRLKCTDAFVELATAEGFTITKDKYSKISEKLLRRKEEYEKQLDTYDTPTINTAELMIGRLDNLLENLFLDQELSKLNRR